MSEASDAYERAAREILKHLRGRFGIATVEDKQDVLGASGTSWEIDGKAVDEKGERFFIVEARRYTTDRLAQEGIGAIAFRIIDTGAAGGFVVSPLPLQKGAAIVARAARIRHLQVSADSTPENYVVEFLSGALREVYLGMTDFVEMSDSVTVTAIDAHSGEIIQQSVDGVITKRRDSPVSRCLMSRCASVQPLERALLVGQVAGEVLGG